MSDFSPTEPTGPVTSAVLDSFHPAVGPGSTAVSPTARPSPSAPRGRRRDGRRRPRRLPDRLGQDVDGVPRRDRRRLRRAQDGGDADAASRRSSTSPRCAPSPSTSPRTSRCPWRASPRRPGQLGLEGAGAERRGPHRRHSPAERTALRKQPARPAGHHPRVALPVAHRRRRPGRCSAASGPSSSTRSTPWPATSGAPPRAQPRAAGRSWPTTGGRLQRIGLSATQRPARDGGAAAVRRPGRTVRADRRRLRAPPATSTSPSSCRRRARGGGQPHADRRGPRPASPSTCSTTAPP